MAFDTHAAVKTLTDAGADEAASRWRWSSPAWPSAWSRPASRSPPSWSRSCGSSDGGACACGGMSGGGTRHFAVCTNWNGGESSPPEPECSVLDSRRPGARGGRASPSGCAGRRRGGGEVLFGRSDHDGRLRSADPDRAARGRSCRSRRGACCRVLSWPRANAGRYDVDPGLPPEHRHPPACGRGTGRRGLANACHGNVIRGDSCSPRN